MTTLINKRAFLLSFSSFVNGPNLLVNMRYLGRAALSVVFDS